MQNFATFAEPLRWLTECKAEFHWTTQCQDGFEQLCGRSITTPILAFPDYSKEFILGTDASDTVVGAVLSKEQSNETKRVIAYVMHILTK